MSLASLRLHSLSKAFAISTANSRRLNLLERSVKCGGNGSQPPSHEASIFASATTRQAGVPRKTERRSRKPSLFHFSTGSFWSLITSNRLALIFLIDKLAAASPSRGG